MFCFNAIILLQIKGDKKYFAEISFKKTIKIYDHNINARGHGKLWKFFTNQVDEKVHAFLKHTVCLWPILVRHNKKRKFPKTEEQ